MRQKAVETLVSSHQTIIRQGGRPDTGIGEGAHVGLRKPDGTSKVTDDHTGEIAIRNGKPGQGAQVSNRTGALG